MHFHGWAKEEVMEDPWTRPQTPTEKDKGLLWPTIIIIANVLEAKSIIIKCVAQHDKNSLKHKTKASTWKLENFRNFWWICPGMEFAAGIPVHDNP